MTIPPSDHSDCAKSPDWTVIPALLRRLCCFNVACQHRIRQKGEKIARISLINSSAHIQNRCCSMFIIYQRINQSIKAEFVGRRYTTRPGAPAESVKSTIKKYILESFSKSTSITNIMKVGWKTVSGGWTGVEEVWIAAVEYILSITMYVGFSIGIKIP